MIEDVWHLRFVPETNSLAVHVSRLRSKLKLFGLAELLMTTASKEYVLQEPERETHPLPLEKTG